MTLSRLVVALMLAATAVLSPARARAQEPAKSSAPSSSMASLLNQMEKSPAGTGSLEAFRLTSNCSDYADSTTRDRCWTAYRAYFDYYESGFGHRKTVFWWQHVSSVVIFVVVLALVAIGVFFAWLQFRRDLRAPHALAAGETAPAVHQLELGQTGLKVSSPVLGVIILVISLAFFYLYLVYVYPIGELL